MLLHPEVDLDLVAERTDLFSGADLESLAKEVLHYVILFCSCFCELNFIFFLLLTGGSERFRRGSVCW